MPLYWTAASQAGTAISTQAQHEIAAALAVAGWVVAAGIAWWYGEQQPVAGVNCTIEFEPSPSWQCEEHPNLACYGPEWGCMGGGCAGPQ